MGVGEDSEGSFGMEKRGVNSFSAWMRVQDQFEAVLGKFSYFYVGEKRGRDSLLTVEWFMED
jgi:hypothetical protein